ncbi:MULTISPECIES: NADP-dependent oxidoreductase [Ferrimicrobium]|jgi:NADPH:quinone reductase-like Zn-dependent oxidoreductase|uniref:NADP-dependent oxidoreductase n=1 Tax=Ferrimicrobium acidiphilum TaxID=121039 RepID=A0ABV3Y5L4_9ACTN|nr:NADP-dependent oxidoreductase [Ferrimicrobium sp.]
MNAVYYQQFGSLDVLDFGDLDVPQLGPDSVLVQVAAASVNPVDWKVMSGGLSTRITSVFPVVPGWDLAGVVREVGPSVTQVEVGDAVWGYARMDYVHHGTFAEFTAVPERVLAPRPPSLTASEAAAMPLAALTAYQALVHRIQLNAEDKLLVIGGAGGVGGFAIQIARALGATVYATGSLQNHSYLESLGAHPVKHGVEQLKALNAEGLTAVLDLYGGEPLQEGIRLLKGAKRVVTIADPTIIAQGGHYVFVQPSRTDLDALSALVQHDQLHAHIQEHFPLEQVKAAFAVSMEGHVRGKLVIDIAEI